MSSLMFQVNLDEYLLKEARSYISRFSDRVNNSGDGLKKFMDRYMRPRTKKTFNRLSNGGTYRGVKWNPYELSTLKSGGGGKLLQKTGHLMKGATDKAELKINRYSARLGIPASYDPKAYAQQFGRRVLGIKNPRPFLFFEVPKDVKAVEEFLTKFYFEELDNATIPD